ncbi:MAG: hypothetical protein KDE15_05115 [Erythrobacter sp.]|nr:hypothetical protein [Erythrobacter sp.]
MTGTYDEADYLSPAPRGAQLRPAWQRLGLPIAGIVLLAGGSAAAIGLSTQKVYEAEAQVELITPEAADPASMPSQRQRIAVARTSAVAAAADRELRLLGEPRFLLAHPSLRDNTLSLDENRTRAAAIILQGTGTQAEEDSTFASITYRSTDRELAARIANGLARAFVTADAQHVAGALGANRAELEALVEQVRGELEEAERAMTGSMTDADILAMPAAEAELVATDGSDALTDETRITLSTELALVRGELSRVEAAIASGALDSSDPVIADLQESREGLEQEYQRITAQFRSDYPAAQDVRRRIEAIDAALAREGLRLAGDRAQDQRRLTARESEIQGQLAALGSDIEGRGAAGSDLDSLQQQVIDKRALYELLVARLAMTNDDDLPTTARVIDAALVPVYPVIPNWYWLGGGAAGIALLLSGLLVWFDWRKRKRLRGY